MLAQIMLRVVPMFLTIFISFFGHLIAHIVRGFAVFWTATAPAFMPAIQPDIDTGVMVIDVPKFLMMAGAIFAGGLAMFVSVKNRNFGMRVQVNEGIITLRLKDRDTAVQSEWPFCLIQSAFWRESLPATGGGRLG